MPRKPTETVQVNLRIKESERRRLEGVAKKKGVSLNYEMTRRLTESFEREDKFKLQQITSDIAIEWARWSDALFDKEQSGDLVRAAEVLVALLAQSAPDREVVEEAAAQVQKTIKAIKGHAEASARARSSQT